MGCIEFSDLDTSKKYQIIIFSSRLANNNGETKSMSAAGNHYMKIKSGLKGISTAQFVNAKIFIADSSEVYSDVFKLARS